MILYLVSRGHYLKFNKQYLCSGMVNIYCYSSRKRESTGRHGQFLIKLLVIVAETKKGHFQNSAKHQKSTSEHEVKHQH